MGYEYRVRFEVNPLDPRVYAPDELLLKLTTSAAAVACNGGDATVSPRRVYEYRARSGADGWPAVVITVEPEGFLVLENDRGVGTELLGPLVKYALSFAKDERVTIEGV